MLHLYIITCQSCVYFQKLHHICVPWHFQNKLLWNGTVFCIHLINTNATFITGTLMKRVTELGEGNFSTESEPGAGRTCPSARAVCRQVCPGAEAGAGGLGQTRSGRRGERQRAARGCVQSARPCTAGWHLAVPVTRRRPRQAHACPAWEPRGGGCPGHSGVRAWEGGAGASFTLRVISSVPASRWTACVAGPVAGRPLRLTTLLVTSRGCAGWRAAAPRERLPARPVTPSPTRGPFSSMCTEYSQESHVTCERHSFQQTRKRSVLP